MPQHVQWYLSEYSKRWRSSPEEQAFVHYGNSSLDHNLWSLPKSYQHVVTSYSAVYIGCSTVLSRSLFGCKLTLCIQRHVFLILLSPLRQMPPWHQVTHATAILSGIVYNPLPKKMTAHIMGRGGGCLHKIQGSFKFLDKIIVMI